MLSVGSGLCRLLERGVRREGDTSLEGLVRVSGFLVFRIEEMEKQLAGCSKRSSSKAAAGGNTEGVASWLR